MEFKNFEDYDDDREQEEQQETSFIDDDDDFEDANDELLFDKDKDLKKKLPFSQDEKRVELRTYFRDTVYADSLSRRFLDNLQFKDSSTADGEMEVLYKGIEIGTIDLAAKELTINMDGIQRSGYKRDHREIINHRNSTFIGQIEENTGEQGFVNEVIAENTRKKFAIEMKKREGVRDPGEHIELEKLREDFQRLERGKKLETHLGREILDSQITNTRRILELRKVLKRIPAIGFLLASAVGVVTAIVLFAKGQFYKASARVQGVVIGKDKLKGIVNKDKLKAFLNPKGIKSYSLVEQAQKIASQILESAGDNFEILTATVAIAFYIKKK